MAMASGDTAAGDDGASRELPHLRLPGTPDSGRGHGSDAPPPPQGLMDMMSMSGCGRFAALVAETPTVSDVFQQRLVAGGGGLTLFCPDDKAVDAFEPTFRALPGSVRANVLLHHGAAARYVRAQLAPFDWVAVPTLAVADTACNETRRTVLARDTGDKIKLWPTWPQQSVATVTKTVSSSEAPLVLYVVDAVLLREKLDGTDEAAACGGCIPVWAAIVGFLSGWFGRSMLGKLRIKDAVKRARHALSKGERGSRSEVEKKPAASRLYQEFHATLVKC